MDAWEESAPEAPSSELPAPWVNPWRQLAQALAAVLASVALRSRELWRRNRQGLLPAPRLWPASLRPLFWPLVLLSLLAALGLPLLLVSGRPPARAASVTARAEPTPEPPPQEVAPIPSPPPAGEPTDTARPPEPEPPAVELDPLLALLQEQDPLSLIAIARPRPAAGLLELELRNGFQALTPAQRLRQAEDWQRRARELGYESLALRNGRGEELGRSAVVGEGMIVLDESSGA
jgi:hypothetical protein